MDKWFALQVAHAAPRAAAATARDLTRTPGFRLEEPQPLPRGPRRAVDERGGLPRSHGAAYRLLADWLIRLDPLNPQTTARMCTAFETWGATTPTGRR
jgi:aminopeptidase N